MKFKALTAVGLIAALSAITPASALDKVPHLSLDVAKRMVAACEAVAVAKGWRLNIAVVDSGANLVAFARMDNAYLGSIEIALDKARTSARFPFTTRFVAELGYGKDGQPGGVPGIVQVPGIIAFAGGLPIMAGKTQVGGIGVSGATADEDEVCAQAAIDAVAADLN